MDIDIIFRIAGIGLIATIINMVLKKCDKDEIYIQIVTIAAIAICLTMMIDMIAGLFDSIRSIFRLY